MSSTVSYQDVVQQILSFLPASKIGKGRLLNRESNKRTYESWFLNLHRQRSNSISGYFIQGSKLQISFVNESEELEKIEVSIEFLPPGKVKIEACDARNGILLCTNERGPSVSELVVCKPTTKQYQVIPNSILPTRSRIFGLTVTGLNPFRYKILRLSKSRRNRNLRTFICEVFDSDTFTWKRIKNLRLPRNEGLPPSKPVLASGCMHWLTWHDNVVRFCVKTEAWSTFSLPNIGFTATLVNYEGKLGVVRKFCWQTEDDEKSYQIWVLNDSSKKLWEKVKDFKDIGVEDDVTWTPSNEVVVLSRGDRLCFYNTNTDQMKIVEDLVNYDCFPFCSDSERVDLNRHITTNIVTRVLRILAAGEDSLQSLSLTSATVAEENELDKAICTKTL